jgi:hypothetical protein
VLYLCKIINNTVLLELVLELLLHTAVLRRLGLPEFCNNGEQINNIYYSYYSCLQLNNARYFYRSTCMIK